MATHPQVEEAVRVMQANRRWIYKQTSKELEKAVKLYLHWLIVSGIAIDPWPQGRCNRAKPDRRACRIDVVEERSC
jgi:hypothetical protein